MINIICEVFDILGTSGACINEIVFLNKSGATISYSTTSADCFDSYTGSITTYWNNSNFWSRDNLKDGAIGYTSNATGTTNSTYFFGGGVKGKYARFLIQLNINSVEELGKIRSYIGDVENRTPVSVNYFYAKNYDKTRHLNNRDNSDLQLLGNLNFSQVVTISTAFDISINLKKFLIKENNQYYSLKSEFYDSEEDIYRPQLIPQEPVNADFENYGIDNLIELEITAFNKIIQEKFNILTLK